METAPGSDTSLKVEILRTIFRSGEGDFAVHTAAALEGDSAPAPAGAGIPAVGGGSPGSPRPGREGLFPSARVRLVGPVAGLGPGDRVEVFGHWTEHARHGRQFRVQRFERISGGSPGVAMFLGSGLIPGVGPALARAIITALDPTLEQLPTLREEDLRRVPGIGRTRARLIRAALEKQKDVIRSTRSLIERGVEPGLALRLYEEYGVALGEKLAEDPVDAALRLPGVGFAAALTLAGQLGDYRPGPRLAAAIPQCLQKARHREGHVYLPEEELFTRVVRLLSSVPEPRHGAGEGEGAEGVGHAGPTGPPAHDPGAGPVEGIDDPRWTDALSRLAREGRIHGDDHRIYLSSLLAEEMDLARDLLRVDGGFTSGLDAGAAAAAASAAADGMDIVLEDEQRTAVEHALAGGLTVITGGPGTGKTTIVKVILEAWRRLRGPGDPEGAGTEEAAVHLAAPTGRAARRLADLTGAEAGTIHRLLEYVPADDGEMAFRRSRENPLSGAALIIDEASMLDLPLAARLIEAVPTGMQVVLVGDADQLPPVGPGSVLRDIIAGMPRRVVKLERIFRQDEASSIVLNAHRVREGRRPLPGGRKDAVTADFRLLNISDRGSGRGSEEVVDQVLALIGAGVAPADECQVMAPMWRGEWGVHRLNERLQEALNPGAGQAELRRDNTVFRVGDRVMCMKNNYTKGSQGIFNGHVGRITDIFGPRDERTVMVLFDDEEVPWGAEEFGDLELAYACTIHKAQGSEFTAVILCLMKEHGLMLDRNLLYTGMTRARESLTIVTEPGALNRALLRRAAHGRYSHLAQRLN